MLDERQFLLLLRKLGPARLQCLIAFLAQFLLALDALGNFRGFFAFLRQKVIRQLQILLLLLG